MVGPPSVSECVLPWRPKVKTYQPGWYTAIPLKHHRGGRCIYCLANFQYIDVLKSTVLPETNDHEMRRVPADQEVVFGLDRTTADFVRRDLDPGDSYDDHGEWRLALVNQAQAASRRGTREMTDGS